MATDRLLIDAAERIFADNCDKARLDQAEAGTFPAALWQVITDNGFQQLALADSGVELADAFAVVRQSGRHALPVPLAEALLANRWLGDSAVLTSLGRVDADRVVDIPWGRQAERILGIDFERGAFVQIPGPGAGTAVTEGSNLAGEPRDSVALPAGAEWVPLLEPVEPALAYLALARSAAMAGALERILELCLQYAGEREQFGRPIGRFQALQHNLAVMAQEVAAAGRAADAGMDAIGGDRFELEVAAAKARVGEAAGIVAEIAHQVHGAMGYTHEHQLHHFTRRVWAWRDEYGNEVFWQARLGSHLAARGADRLWDFLATRG